MEIKDVFGYAEELMTEVEAFSTEKKEELEQFRIAFLGTKGKVKDLFSNFKAVSNDRKKEFGQLANKVKQTAEAKFKLLKELVDEQTTQTETVPDLTLPVNAKLGSRHPIAIVRNKMIDIFARIGFTVAYGPEIDDDWHNFTALNTPPNHPARDMQDTFYIDRATDPYILLRTHTSSVQTRYMQKNKPPIRIIAPGRVFRNETISARAHCQFHQVEGLYIDENVSLADLRQTLLYFAQEMFGKNTKIRLRPSYFPFTEPSAEMDISCFICNQEGCAVCKKTGWVEILGCGMVDPEVLENCGIDSKKYTGFAFGMGVERTAMLKYRLNDIRLLFENDVRFLQQFEAAL